MNRLLFIILAGFAVMQASMGTAAWQSTGNNPVMLLPQEYQQDVMVALKQAGEHAGKWRQVIAECPDAQRKALGFLLANMPQKDLVGLSADFILKNIALAYQAIEKMPWGQMVPEEIFLNYVLPYANMHERRDNWRADFYEKFMPLVRNCRTPGEACQALNKKMWDVIQVHYDTRRPKADQSPYESIEAGMATCTGLSILLVDACRAVGVPARFVGIPMWTNMSGNHSWVEVWDNGWHYIGAGEPGPFDKTWFTGRAATTDPNKPQHRIYAVSFRKTNLKFPAMWKREIDVYAEDVTARYLKKQTTDERVKVAVRVMDKPDGKRISLPVEIWQNGQRVADGVSRHDRNDLNDVLTFHLKPGAEYELRVIDGDRMIKNKLRVKGKNEQLIDIFLLQFKGKRTERE